jgi:hypothetical protein
VTYDFFNEKGSDDHFSFCPILTLNHDRISNNISTHQILSLYFPLSLISLISFSFKKETKQKHIGDGDEVATSSSCFHISTLSSHLHSKWAGICAPPPLAFVIFSSRCNPRSLDRPCSTLIPMASPPQSPTILQYLSSPVHHLHSSQPSLQNSFDVGPG